MNDGLSVDEVHGFPAMVDLAPAGKAFGKSYELATAGSFPCQIMRIGTSWRVPKAAILFTLGLVDRDSVLFLTF